jgi:hypothetical protein
MYKNVANLPAISMTMPPGLYKVINIAQWSTTVASGEATKRCHPASACPVLPWQPPWSSTSGWKKTQPTTNILPSNYCSFLLVVCEKFIAQNGPSTQHINAASFVRKC